MCCQVCYDWLKGSLTNKEALRNLSEMINTENNEEEKQHYYEVANIVLDNEEKDNGNK